METLALQLAELLEISIDKAIELYPVLRTQFVWYKIANLLNGLGLLILLPTVIVGVVELMDKGIKELYIKTPIVKLLVASATLILLGSLTAYIFATDLMIILEFL
jgi:uncharacterized protein YqgQ